MSVLSSDKFFFLPPQNRLVARQRQVQSLYHVLYSVRVNRDSGWNTSNSECKLAPGL